MKTQFAQVKPAPVLNGSIFFFTCQNPYVVLYHPALFWLFGPYFCTKIFQKNVRPHLNILNEAGGEGREGVV